MRTKSKIKGLLTIGEISVVNGSTVQSDIDDMMGNLAISTPVLRITRDILSKEIMVIDEETGKIDKEKTERMKSIVGFEDYVKSLSFIIFGEFIVHELVYGVPLDGDLQISELIRLPNNYVNFDIETYKSTNGWYYSDSDGNDLPIKDGEFIKSVFGYSIDYPMGYGLFRNGVSEAYDDLVNLEAQIRALSLKYGSTIPIFGYNPIEAETPEGLASLQARVDGIREMSSDSNSVIGIPLTGRDTSLKDGFQTISLADLNIEMHNTLKTNLENKLETFLMGARFSSTDTGSHAKEQVQAEQKDKMMYQITRTITTELDKLLKYDAELFGYDATGFHFEMHEFLTEREKIAVKQTELILESQISSNINTKAAAYIQLVETIGKLKFEGIDDNTIVDLFDLDPAFVTPIQPKDISTTETVVKEEGEEQNVL